MRILPLTILSLVASTAAFAQGYSVPPGWELRRTTDDGLGARARPNNEPGLLAPAANVTGVFPTSAPPYKGYAFLGGTLYTGITAGTYYDDNVFAGNTRRLSDVAFTARPEFVWRVVGNNFAAALDGYIEGRSYTQYQSENQLNGSFGGTFKVQPAPDLQILGGARYIHAHIDRGASETVAANGVLLSTIFASPIAYDQGIGTLTLNKRFDNNWWTSVGVSGVGVKIDNQQLAGFNVDLGYANGGIGVVNGRIGAVVAPLTSVFAEVAGNKRAWQVDAFSSQGYRVVGGVLLDPGQNARLRGEVWAGYMAQNYNGPSFQNVSTWTYGASLAMVLADGLTGTLEGRREAKESALALAVLNPTTIGTDAVSCAIGAAACASAIQSTVTGRLDYRVLPGVVVGGGAAYVVDEYLGAIAGGRVDRTLSPLASVKWIPNDRTTFGFDYRYVNFDPTGGQSTGVQTVSYTRNIYLLSMNGRF